MKLMFRGWLSAVWLLSLGAASFIQQLTSWRDPSPHMIQFVTVDKDVQLEVLDWGGSCSVSDFHRRAKISPSRMPPSTASFTIKRSHGSNTEKHVFTSSMVGSTLEISLAGV